MRHGNKINHLGRKYGHRRALLANLATQLIMHKRIVTTVAKAKELRVYVEPLVTKSKDNTTHQRRIVFGYLQDKAAAKELFDVVAPKVGDRPGGYTRIIRTGFRPGDNAEMAFIELVDFNEVYTAEKSANKAKKRTRRAGASKSKKEQSEVVNETVPVSDTAEVAESVIDVAEPTHTEETKSE
jgi:large subunit ribosomal protein L17